MLDLRPAEGFTDYFVIMTGQNTRQIQAISDAIQESLGSKGVKPAHIEGGDRAGWILLDYFDFIVHIFSPESRAFYSLERLWGSAERIDVPEPAPPHAKGSGDCGLKGLGIRCCRSHEQGAERHLLQPSAHHT